MSPFTPGAPPPTNLTTEKLQLSSVALRWTKAEGMETIPHHFLITYSSPATQSHTTETGDCCTTLTHLLPGTHYTVGVCTVLDQARQQSKPASTTIITGETLVHFKYSFYYQNICHHVNVVRRLLKLFLLYQISLLQSS